MYMEALVKQVFFSVVCYFNRNDKFLKEMKIKTRQEKEKHCKILFSTQAFIESSTNSILIAQKHETLSFHQISNGN